MRVIRKNEEDSVLKDKKKSGWSALIPVDLRQGRDAKHPLSAVRVTDSIRRAPFI
jgi:hypothetical protein